MPTPRYERRIRVPKQLIAKVHRRVTRTSPMSRRSVAHAIARLLARARPVRWLVPDVIGGPHGVYQADLLDRPVEIHVAQDEPNGDGTVVDVRLPTEPAVDEGLTSGAFALQWRAPRRFAEAVADPRTLGAGVYVLERRGNPIFVGQSTALRARLQRHAAALRRVLGPALDEVQVRIAHVVRNEPGAFPTNATPSRSDLQTVERVLIRYLIGNRMHTVERPVRTADDHATGVAMHNATSFRDFTVPVGPIDIDLGRSRPPYLQHRRLTLRAGSR